MRRPPQARRGRASLARPCGGHRRAPSPWACTPLLLSVEGTLREHRRGHARPRSVTPSRPIPSLSRAVLRHVRLVRRRNRHPQPPQHGTGLLIQRLETAFFQIRFPTEICRTLIPRSQVRSLSGPSGNRLQGRIERLRRCLVAAETPGGYSKRRLHKGTFALLEFQISEACAPTANRLGSSYVGPCDSSTGRSSSVTATRT
jgi:hypothetical protein